MHFWIDKRSQTVGRRRVPPNLAHIAGGGGRHWVLGGGKAAAPVHHHGSLHGAGGGVRPGEHQEAPRRPEHWSQHHRPHPEPSSHRLEVDPYVVVSSVVVAESPPVRSSASHVRLRYALWASFILILVFAFAGAKFYLYQQVGSGGLEVVVTSAVMVVIMYLVVGCSLSLCRSSQRATPAGTSAPVERPAPPSREEPAASDQQHATRQRSSHPLEPPPPPYHIAVGLPQCVTPPPSYDKAVS